MKNLLGGKGANLAEMTNLGIPVPPGFSITTDTCLDFYYEKEQFPDGLKEEVGENLNRIEGFLGFQWGSPEKPLLVSVRSGARISMPGMMDTILNLGLNDSTVKGLTQLSGDERFAFDSYRRLIQMYGNVVLGIDSDHFETALEKEKEKQSVTLDTDLKTAHLKNLVATYKEIIQRKISRPFPQNVNEQLWGAISAVFRSWHSKRAIEYRKIENIPDDWGTAVNVQAMVFGNMGHDCATGVAFTRDPSTGEKIFYGEFLVNAQGEDVVAGIRTPQPINRDMARDTKGKSLEEEMPKAYSELVGVYQKLEKHYQDMQDIEFTIQKEKLWLLQTRTGKRTAKAALKIACDLVDEKLISKEQAILRITADQINQLLHPQFDQEAKRKSKILAHGLPASPGAACGEVYFSAEKVAQKAKEGKSTLLVRRETSPEDIEGMNLARGILTARGGMTSHAAVVARGMGRTCVVGCNDLDIDYEKGQAHFHTQDGKVTVSEADVLSIDGSTGEIILGKVSTIPAETTGEFEKLMKWCDEIRRLRVRANADTAHDARIARKFGAEGIGLCRTEHMFFGEDRISKIRQVILADQAEERRKALKKILPLQKQDFIEIFREMRSLPVTIRLLDPPLHEFLPHGESEVKDLSKELDVSEDKIKHKIKELTEVNPMLGHRGCRLGITYPEIYETQIRAIMEAACELTKKEGFQIVPEIMFPLIALRKEIVVLRKRAIKICEEIISQTGTKIDYRIGTMIEIPRAALCADSLAEEADFFSFGTNDLTQLTMGISRDDANHFLPYYLTHKVFSNDPFVSLDKNGVGRLVRMGVEKGRKVKKDLKTAICGEHGGDPESIRFCHEIGLNYVSCSPFRVPISRLCAAQAVLEERH